VDAGFSFAAPVPPATAFDEVEQSALTVRIEDGVDPRQGDVFWPL